MDLKEIRQLLKMVEGSDIHEIEIEENGNKLRITKAVPSNNGEIHVIQAAAPAVAAPFPQPVAAPVMAVAATPAPAPVAEPEKAENVAEVCSPMVGTFYRAPSPDADSYVEVGQSVAVGQTMCIVEAMKLLNEIESEVSGKVVEILVENAQPVEYNQVLFLVEKS